MSASARIICALVWFIAVLVLVHGTWAELLIGIAFVAYVLAIHEWRL